MSAIAIRFITGMPIVDKKRSTDLINDQWVRLKELNNMMITLLLSIPIMAISAFFTLAIAGIFVPVPPSYFGIGTDSILISLDFLLIVGIVLLIPVHEFAHLLLVPGFIKSDRTYISLTYLGGFVYSEEVITKPRHIAISIAPFFIISIILPVIMGMAGLLSQHVIVLAVLNSLGSSIDIFYLILVLTQVPSGARLTANGMNTYWKNNSTILNPTK